MDKACEKEKKMFSENNQVSARQIKYLLILEWIARLCILLPVCLQGKSTGSQVICIAAGLVLWCLVWKMISRWIRPGESFFDALSRVGGTALTVMVSFVGLVYFVAYAAVFLYLCGQLASLYLLPEVPLIVLFVLPLAAGVYLSAGSLEVRARFCEVTGPVVIGLILLLIFLSAFGMEAYQSETTLVSLEDAIGRGSWEVFACMGGMFLPVLAGYAKSDKLPRKIQRAGIFSMVAAGSLCFITAASFGKNGMEAFSFPAVRVMSNVRVPGGFMQRWDIVFLFLLLFSLIVTVAGAFWYMRIFWERLWAISVETYARKKQGEQELTQEGAVVGAGVRNRGLYGGWAVLLALVFLAAAGFNGELAAVCYYRAFLMQFLIPGLFIFYIAAGFVRRRKLGDSVALRFRPRAVIAPTLLILFFAAAFWLAGCTAHEPEERIFPMALQIGMNGDLLDIEYAFNDEELVGFEAGTLEEILQQAEDYSERRMDYSHVKALLLDESLKSCPEQEEEVMQWFAGEPAFASGLIVYRPQEVDMTLEEAAERADGEIGTFLEQLYENNAVYREKSTTLGKVIAGYYAEEI